MKSEAEQETEPKIERDVKPYIGKDVQPKLEPGLEPRIPFNTELKSTTKAIPKLEQDNDQDGLAALDALESEAKEFNKVSQSLSPYKPLHSN